LASSDFSLLGPHKQQLPAQTFVNNDVFSEATVWCLARISMQRRQCNVFSLRRVQQGVVITKKSVKNAAHAQALYLCGSSPDVLSQCHGVLFADEEVKTDGRTILMSIQERIECQCTRLWVRIVPRLLMFSAYTVHAGLNFSLLESFVVRVL
jgi:hypothetical protein